MKIIDKDTINISREKSSDNLILIDKPVNWSSFDVVKKIRYLTRIKKVGHGGTLDPFATGLLILGTGRETKVLSKFNNGTKEYIAGIELGISTDTYDITGKITRESEVEKMGNLDIQSVLESFLGESEQIPPMYSAKKVGGKRLYKMARQGKEIERKAQIVNIHEIRELRQSGAEVEIYVKCSKGTYIRALANEIGKKCGCGAVLKSLRRIAVNNYIIDKALTIQDFDKYWNSLN
jgi:tRNA pseudouridine55 synthase